MEAKRVVVIDDSEVVLAMSPRFSAERAVKY